MFWRSILGIFLLLIVCVVSLNVGEFIQETEAVSGGRGIIKGIGTIFKKMEERKEGKKQIVVVLDAGHGGGWNRPKNYRLSYGQQFCFLLPIKLDQESFICQCQSNMLSISQSTTAPETVSISNSYSNEL